MNLVNGIEPNTHTPAVHSVDSILVLHQRQECVELFFQDLTLRSKGAEARNPNLNRASKRQCQQMLSWILQPTSCSKTLQRSRSVFFLLISIFSRTSLHNRGPVRQWLRPVPGFAAESAELSLYFIDALHQLKSENHSQVISCELTMTFVMVDL